MPTSAFNSPRASLICVGSELLRGKINTHASTLARRLASIGLELNEEHTVGDELEPLARAIAQALQENDLVIVTGGLGPTFDDLTREAAAEACGRQLVRSSKLLREIQSKFRRARLRAMPPANERQAYLIHGAQPISNKVGTAPGQWLHVDGKLLILLPGPPSELIPMLDEAVIPRLKKTFPTAPRAEAHLHFIGVPESVVDHRIRPIIDKEKGAQFTILAHLGLVDLDIFAQKGLARIVQKIRAKMGRAFYGMNADYPLEKVVMKNFVSNKATLALAESCTGGLLGQRLTEVPGSSAYSGGVVSYSNAIKVSILGIPPATLRAQGAVSKPVAAAMAQGVRQKMGSTWGVGITGIAGPSGGTRQKPLGLVYISLAGPRSIRTFEFYFRGSRDAIRQRAALAALDLLRLIYL